MSHLSGPGGQFPATARVRTRPAGCYFSVQVALDGGDMTHGVGDGKAAGPAAPVQLVGGQQRHHPVGALTNLFAVIEESGNAADFHQWAGEVDAAAGASSSSSSMWMLTRA